MSIFTNAYSYQQHKDGDDNPFDDDYLMQIDNHEAPITADDAYEDYSNRETRRRNRTRAPELFKYIDDTVTFQGRAVADDDHFGKLARDLGTSYDLARKYNAGDQADRDLISQRVGAALKWEAEATGPQRAAQRKAAEKAANYRRVSNAPRLGFDHADMGGLAPYEAEAYFNGTPEDRKAIAAPINAAMQPWRATNAPTAADPLGDYGLGLANAVGGMDKNADGNPSRTPFTKVEESSQVRTAHRGEKPGEIDIDRMSPLDVVRHWATNDGGTLHFGPNSRMSKEFSKSNGAKEFKKFYRDKFYNEDKPLFLYPVKVDNFDRTFRSKRVLDADSWAEHVVGSFENGTAERVGDNIVFRVENTMGLNSLFYARPLGDFTEDAFGERVELFGERPGDLHMTIEWEVPLSSIL